jgi:hypothetical protein
MVGLHDLFRADRAPTLTSGEGFRQRVTVGRRKDPRLKPDFRRAVGAPNRPRLLKREAVYILGGRCQHSS